jgi:tRNA threonylcarbamoyl adenosine modification protein YjeE
MAEAVVTIDLPDEAATAMLAEDVASRLAPGDVIALHGGLGAGKTSFARALIRAIADDPALEVPSPTFTLVQTYPGRVAVAHFDLYRLSDAGELDEIGFDDAIGEGAALVEWPERAGGRLPADRLDVELEIAGWGRRATLRTGGTWAARLARSRAVRAFLDASGWRGAMRRHLQGDASTRVYERVAAADRHAVVMDWAPPAVDAPRDPRAGHRARDVHAFVAVDNALRGLGLSAPEILAADMEAGLLLLEEFPRDWLFDADGAPIRERYLESAAVLALVHAGPRPAVLPLPAGGSHALPPYGDSAFAVEAEFLPDWYVPHVTGRPISPEGRAEFVAVWAALIRHLGAFEKSWVLLDYHSPNIHWLAGRRGLARVGIIDFQDMMLGPSAYDVASLGQDARVTVPPALEAEMKARYVALRRADPAFDIHGFEEAYAILTAHRNTKILGVFARLAAHGRPLYLKHIPRLREYLRRSLAHPALKGYALWYQTYLPSTE